MRKLALAVMLAVGVACGKTSSPTDAGAPDGSYLEQCGPRPWGPGGNSISGSAGFASSSTTALGACAQAGGYQQLRLRLTENASGCGVDAGSCEGAYLDFNLVPPQGHPALTASTYVLDQSQSSGSHVTGAAYLPDRGGLVLAGLGVNSGQLTLTSLTPNISGSFTVTLHEPDGTLIGDLSGSFDTRLCGTDCGTPDAGTGPLGTVGQRCATAEDCGRNTVCSATTAGSYCAQRCCTDLDCPATEPHCAASVTTNLVQICQCQSDGTCGGAGFRCDSTTHLCHASPDGGAGAPVQSTPPENACR